MAKKKCMAYEKLIEDGWFTSKSEIIPWVMARRVLADNKPVLSPSEKISVDAEIRIREYYKTRYVGKGGLKLEHAISEFGIDVDGKIAFDCGACTGGFTDCLRVHGAELVYAVEVGHGQLAGKLMQDDAVINLEYTNLSDEKLKYLDPKPSVVSLDVSYLSLEVALREVKSIISEDGDVIALVKPIFEVDSSEVRQSGKINDAKLHFDVINKVKTYSEAMGFYAVDITYSPVRGNNGAVEYFMYLTLKVGTESRITDEKIKNVIEIGLALDVFKK
ncbi:MAG: TlyA family RNA methyltransferase [Clostridia bacterium]|nr:TlyA family RNA methyltransferase [Clostridia bacterium]